VSYETFKIFGKIYERKYQSDILEGFEGINPVLEFLDSILLEMSRKTGKMNSSIRDAFTLAFAESTFLENLNSKEEGNVEEILKKMNSFNIPETSPAKFLLESVGEIKNNKWFNVENQNLAMVYALAAMKRKYERYTDWTYCSLDKELISMIEKEDKLVQLSSLVSESYNTESYYPNNAYTASKLNFKLKKMLNSDRWSNSQHLALLFKNDDKEKDLSYIESRVVPDANDLQEVIALIHDVKDNKINIEYASSIMKVTPRMAKYYLDAAGMLGILKQNGSEYEITEFGEKLKRYSYEDKLRIIEQAVVNLPVFKSFLVYLKANNKSRFRIKDIAMFLDNNTNLSSKTSQRRASTLASWLCIVGMVKRRNNKLYLKEDSGQKKILDYLPTK